MQSKYLSSVTFASPLGTAWRSSAGATVTSACSGTRTSRSSAGSTRTCSGGSSGAGAAKRVASLTPSQSYVVAVQTNNTFCRLPIFKEATKASCFHRFFAIGDVPKHDKTRTFSVNNTQACSTVCPMKRVASCHHTVVRSET